MTVTIDRDVKAEWAEKRPASATVSFELGSAAVKTGGVKEPIGVTIRDGSSLTVFFGRMKASGSFDAQFIAGLRELVEEQRHLTAMGLVANPRTRTVRIDGLVSASYVGKLENLPRGVRSVSITGPGGR